MTTRPSIFARLVVGFAYASAGLGLLLAVGVGSLVAFLGSGGDVVVGFLGARSPNWWLTAAAAWVLLSGVVAVLVVRRESAAKNGGSGSKSE